MIFGFHPDAVIFTMIDQLTLVIVSFNSGHLLIERLEQLRDFNITVIDNASHDGSPATIKQRFPTVHLIESEHNLGFGRAANLGLKSVTTPYALLLNPDVETTPHDIEALLSHVNTITDTWLFLAPNTGTPPSHLKKSSATSNQHPNQTQLDRIGFATGCALLFNVESFHTLGGFDENIFLFFEETDLCKRAENLGYSMYYAPTIIFPHEGGNSVENVSNLSAIKIWHYHWSRLYFCKKHHQWLKLVQLLIKSIVTYPVKLRTTSDPEKKVIYKMRHSAAVYFTKSKPAFVSPTQAFLPESQNTTQ